MFRNLHYLQRIASILFRQQHELADVFAKFLSSPECMFFCQGCVMRIRDIKTTIVVLNHIHDKAYFKVHVFKLQGD